MNRLLMLSLVASLLMACDGNQPVGNANDTAQTAQMPADDLSGCYTIEKDTPATIKISQTDGKYAMQMKEPTGAKEVWDNPESLQTLPKEQGWRYFSVNRIDLSMSDVVSDVLVRDDEMLALAKLHDSSSNTKPLLDSSYVVALMGAVNTIYQVPCDEMRVDLSVHK